VCTECVRWFSEAPAWEDLTRFSSGQDQVLLQVRASLIILKAAWENQQLHLQIARITRTLLPFSLRVDQEQTGGLLRV